MVKKVNKKTQSASISSNNKNTKIIVITCILISITALSITYGLNLNSVSTTDSVSTSSEIMDGYIDSLSATHIMPVTLGVPYFDGYITVNDDLRLQQNLHHVDGLRLELNESFSQQVINSLKPDGNSVVIYPIWTSAAYNEPGFYTYFGGKCDESCITDLSFENPVFGYTSSGLTAQILYNVGYDFLTEIDVDKNPELLDDYDTVILLHNEYVTKKVFDAITSHPNLIFLFPNALYAEIDVNYETNTMTLIRGHQYPPPENPANGFDYDVEIEFHHFEYDDKCMEWEFIEIENGFHLNCYPDGVIHKNLDILVKLKELI